MAQSWQGHCVQLNYYRVSVIFCSPVVRFLSPIEHKSVFITSTKTMPTCQNSTAGSFVGAKVLYASFFRYATLFACEIKIRHISTTTVLGDETDASLEFSSRLNLANLILFVVRSDGQ
jgi:hypothetical protein